MNSRVLHLSAIARKHRRVKALRSGVRDIGAQGGGGTSKPLTGPCIIELGELGLEEVFEMVRLDLLQAHDIGPVTDELCANSM